MAEQWTHEIHLTTGNIMRFNETWAAQMDGSGVQFWSEGRTTMLYYPWNNVIEYKRVKVI